MFCCVLQCFAMFCIVVPCICWSLCRIRRDRVQTDRVRKYKQQTRSTGNQCQGWQSPDGQDAETDRVQTDKGPDRQGQIFLHACRTAGSRGRGRGGGGKKTYKQTLNKPSTTIMVHLYYSVVRLYRLKIITKYSKNYEKLQTTTKNNTVSA